MGGQKKPTISKLKKMLQGKKGRAEKKDEKRRVEYGVVVTPDLEKELRRFILRQKYITPYLISRKGEIKISEARRYLKRLQEERVLRLVIKNRELEVYQPVAS